MDPTVQVAIISTFGVIVTTGLGLFANQNRKHGKAIAEQSEAMAAVKHQVQNSHETNLRDDIDRILRGQDRVEGSLNGIRQDLRVEREERLLLDQRVVRLETA